MTRKYNRDQRLIKPRKKYFKKNQKRNDKYDAVKNILMFLNLIYIQVIGMGMFFNYNKYSLYKINIFSYATIYDFLTLPFSDVKLQVYLYTITFILLFVLIIIPFIIETLFNKYYFLKTTIMMFSYLFFSTFYIYNVKDIYIQNLKNEIKSSRNVQVEFINNNKNSVGVVNAIFYGKTYNYIYLINGEDLDIYNMNTVKRITYLDTNHK